MSGFKVEQHLYKVVYFFWNIRYVNMTWTFAKSVSREILSRADLAICEWSESLMGEIPLKEYKVKTLLWKAKIFVDEIGMKCLLF